MSRTLAALIVCLNVGFLSAAHAQTFKVLYNFQGGNDGAMPIGTLIADAAGNLYGTTRYGGGHLCNRQFRDDCGTIFKLAPDGTETVLYAFRVRAYPDSGVIADPKGDLYASAPLFGRSCNIHDLIGCGGIFRLKPDGRASALYAFQSGADGSYPNGLIRDQAGNLYGTADVGGAAGFGTVFKLAPHGSLTVLRAFVGGNDGRYPASALLADSTGNLFGTTAGGGGVGCKGAGCGTVFKLAPDGTETIPYAFHGGVDGRGPEGSLVEDEAGDLYGTTESGGNGTRCGKVGCGTIFKLAPNGTETVLYAFQGSNDGSLPLGGVVMNGTGNLYGVTWVGGANGAGTVFELSPSGSFTVLHAFAGNDGANPASGLFMDGRGNLYGTTGQGGSGSCNGGCGVVYELTP